MCVRDGNALVEVQKELSFRTYFVVLVNDLDLCSDQMQEINFKLNYAATML